MYEIKDEDLKLSEKFKAAQLKLETKKQEIVAVNKKENNDTIEACLLFQSNISFFKEKAKDKKLVERSNFILDYLLKEFPKADSKVILKLIKKNGIYTYNQIILFLLFTLSIPFLIIQFYLLSSSGWTVSTLLNYCTPLSLVFILLFLVIDANIVHKK